MLCTLPGGDDALVSSLEREYILRRFNIDYLAMEENSGSDLEKVIGLGHRTNTDTGEKDSISNFHQSQIRNIIRAFEVYPITKYFGITIKDALDLPLDQWNYILDESRMLAENGYRNDVESQLLSLLKTMTVGKSDE